MKRHNLWIATIIALMLLGIQPVGAQEEESPEAKEQAELQAAYEDALEAAGHERETAMAAVERARVEMQQVAEESARSDADSERARESHAAARAQSMAEREAEVAVMREELSRAHEELRRASREVARVHRELHRPTAALAPAAGLINLGDRAVIGVILGDSTETGVRVLGVSPDGPAERAGLQQGDVIVSMMDKPLLSDDGPPALAVLHEVMADVESGDELLITVSRGGKSLDYTVTAERREPFGWQSMVRLPSAPHAPGAPVIIERIEIPEIDSAALAEQMERLRADVDHARVIIETRRGEDTGVAPETWEFEYENLSEIGEEAMLGANIWFGMPLTRGLKLAEINAGLGEYFKTDRGVLVLKAKPDNDLQLESGDVILEVGGTRVDKPSDVMRALRHLEPGTDFRMNIMRDRKTRKLDLVVPEQHGKFGALSGFNHEFHFEFGSGED